MRVNVLSETACWETRNRETCAARRQDHDPVTHARSHRSDAAQVTLQAFVSRRMTYHCHAWVDSLLHIKTILLHQTQQQCCPTEQLIS